VSETAAVGIFFPAVEKKFPQQENIFPRQEIFVVTRLFFLSMLKSQ